MTEFKELRPIYNISKDRDDERAKQKADEKKQHELKERLEAREANSGKSELIFYRRLK